MTGFDPSLTTGLTSWRLDLPNPPVFGREPFKHDIKLLGQQGADDLYHLNTQSGSQVCKKSCYPASSQQR